MGLLLIVPFPGAPQSWWEFCFRTGLGLGRKAIAESGALSFFFFYQYYYEAVFLVLAEWSQRNRAAIRKGGGEFSPGQGDAGDPAGRGKLLLKIRIRK